MMTAMRQTWLVQRLNKKPTSSFLAKAEQVFGGGALALKPEAWKLLQSIFGIDYMGAAEFEFGALPKSFQELARDSQNLITFEMRTKPFPDAPVYVLCRKEHEVGAREIIELIAQDKLKLKESTYFRRAFNPTVQKGDLATRTCGWYELNNGFFFFLDKEMWEKTTKLFKDGECDDDEEMESEAAGKP